MKPQPKTARIVSPAEQLIVTVLHTTPEETAGALEAAVALVESLTAKIRVIAIQVVPFPLDLMKPPVPLAFAEEKLRSVAASAGVHVEVEVYSCRDREETLLRILPPHSVVAIGTRRHWFRTKEPHLARLLRRNGHEVIVVNSKDTF